MNDYLSQLNTAQRQAVEYLDGPALVIAGAGSGKTRVLTYKIVHLIESGYNPGRILALTFTNKAANEMRERIETLVGQETASRLWMGTFHSVFARILRYNAAAIGYKSNFTIYDAADSRSLIKSIIKEEGLDEKIYKPTTIANAISMAKNALVSPERYAADKDIAEADKNAKRPLTAHIYQLYCDRCRVAGAMDFDDLLVNTNILLRDNPDIARYYQELFQYILVDEYQDTNFAQNLIVTTLSTEKGNLCVVGDDAQSIYSFRGANIRNIINLDKHFPRLKIFKLEQNYRSTQAILNAANALIEKNKTQIPKRVYATRDGGRLVELCQASSAYEESYIVANAISRLKLTAHDPYSEFAVLYRTNAQSRVLEEFLRKRNISYRIYGGLSFYQRKEVKDAVSYFRLAVNPDDDEALRRIINVPARGIGATTLGKLTRSAIDRKMSIWQVLNDLDSSNPGFNRGTLIKLDNFRRLIQEFVDLNNRRTDADTLARRIIADTRLLSSLMTENTPESISKQENLEELLNGTRDFVNEGIQESEDADTSMATFLTRVSLATDQDSDDDNDSDDRVTLMTVHAAKGLEFTNVFIVGVEEDLFPSAMSNSSIDEIEEERRLLYVAITRAKRYCMMTYARERMRNGQTAACSPSRFLNDIGPENLKLINGTPLPQQSYRSGSAYGQSGVSMPSSRPLASVSISRQPSRRPEVRTASGSNIGASNADPRFTTHTVDQLRTGMAISHSTHGRGIITRIDTEATEPRIEVNFNGPGQKVLLLKFARFEILE